uniref:Uncharacterized protein n=1 Tax=Rhizophora mucronata TaxID=61149 RepID=A0A2P2NDI5_RHIMU
MDLSTMHETFNSMHRNVCVYKLYIQLYNVVFLMDTKAGI